MNARLRVKQRDLEDTCCKSLRRQSCSDDWRIRMVAVIAVRNSPLVVYVSSAENSYKCEFHVVVLSSSLIKQMFICWWLITSGAPRQPLT